MFWSDPYKSTPHTPTRVSRARRPLDRAYIALIFFFIFALAAIVFVTVIQASPSTTQLGIGWYTADSRTGTSFEQRSNDSMLRAAGGPDQIGFEKKLYALINEARIGRGLQPLKSDVALTRAARDHSSDMAKTGRFDAVDTTGRNPVQRADNAGFRPPLFVLEMISAGYQSPEQVIASWLANPQTAAELLNADANMVGVGYGYAREDKTFRHYWTVDVGKLNGLVFSVVVNNGAESTSSAQVLLHIGGAGWAQEMLISNEPDYDGADWEPFSESKTWTLAPGTGPKKIYVKLRGQGDQVVETIGIVALDPAAKGVRPGPPQADTLDAPRPPLLRVPAAEVSLLDRSASGPGGAIAVAANAALAPGYYQTSEFMLGKVVVGIVLAQCNGAVDRCSETWTPKMMDQVVSQIKAGTDWWVRRTNGRLSFVFDEQRQVPTGYEPINHSQADEGLWIGDAMTHLGFAGSTYFEQVYAYNNWMRQKYATDWAFTIFIANSEKSTTGTFSNGYFAYSYVPGPFTVATYDNDGYTINNMASVIAHETGHIFGALDQYSGANIACTATSGYLVLQNQNSQKNCSSNVDSIMRGGVVPYANNLIDEFALGMVGHRVTNSNGLPDPINTTPIIALNPIPAVISKTNPTITGTAQDQPFPSPTGNSVTINVIKAVNYRIDGGDWKDATPSDGSTSFNKVSQGFSFSPQLGSGPHRIEVQAVNRIGHKSGIITASLNVQGVEPTPLPIMLQLVPTPSSTRVPGAPTIVPPMGSNSMAATLSIAPGNNTISVPFSGYTASLLIRAMNAQGASVLEIDSWTGRNWQAYVAGADGTDFDIQPGVGYLLKARWASQWTIPASASNSPRHIKVDKGWYLLGIPPCKDGGSSCYTASSLAEEISAQGGELAEIDRWENGSWSAYQVGYPFNDFPINVGQAYFVRSNRSSSWSP